MNTPQNILAQIPLLATHPFLSISLLEGGHSNQSYLVSTPEMKYVLRFDGEAQKVFNCCREFEIETLKLASAKFLSPKPIFWDFKNGVLLYTFLEGEQLNLEQLADPQFKQQFIDLRHKISEIGKLITLPQPKQDSLVEIILDPNLPEYLQLVRQRKLVESISKELESYTKEYSLCHNDFSPSNLLLDSKSNLFVLDWEYAGNNHPLLDFAFFANNYDLEERWLLQHYPEFILHKSLDFTEIRRLAWYIEAIWYAKRQLNNPSEQWETLLSTALSKL